MIVIAVLREENLLELFFCKKYPESPKHYKKMKKGLKKLVF